MINIIIINKVLKIKLLKNIVFCLFFDIMLILFWLLLVVVEFVCCGYVFLNKVIFVWFKLRNFLVFFLDGIMGVVECYFLFFVKDGKIYYNMICFVYDYFIFIEVVVEI